MGRTCRPSVPCRPCHASRKRRVGCVARCRPPVEQTAAQRIAAHMAAHRDRLVSTDMRGQAQRRECGDEVAGQMDASAAAADRIGSSLSPAAAITWRCDDNAMTVQVRAILNTKHTLKHTHRTHSHPLDAYRPRRLSLVVALISLQPQRWHHGAQRAHAMGVHRKGEEEEEGRRQERRRRRRRSATPTRCRKCWESTDQRSLCAPLRLTRLLRCAC